MAESEDLLAAMRRHPDLSLAAKFGRNLTVIGGRKKAHFSTWYAIFPHSTAMKPGRHGTFAGREKRSPYIASMGFDVVYLPPIGNQFRKEKNNSPAAEPRDAGSLTPVPRHNYRVGAPQDGYRKEVLNSGAPPYGGSGQGNKGGVEASPPPMHGRQRLLSVTPPPPGAVVIKPERA